MKTTQVLIAGGGPVGLATALELGRRGIACVVVEPRTSVTHARPRCKTVNVRTMEHLRRWGLAERLRERAPLPADAVALIDRVRGATASSQPRGRP